jgi:hypothetical protein
MALALVKGGGLGSGGDVIQEGGVNDDGLTGSAAAGGDGVPLPARAPSKPQRAQVQKDGGGNRIYSVETWERSKTWSIVIAGPNRCSCRKARRE